MGAPKMRRYLPRTIYRYQDLPSTQIIRDQNHTDITPPHPITPDPDPNPLPTPHLHHPHHTHLRNPNTDTQVQHYPCSHRVCGAQTQSSHPLTPFPPTPSRAIPISHTPPTPLIPHTTLIHSTSGTL